MSILDKIVADKRVEVAALKASNPMGSWKMPEVVPDDFVTALRSAPMGLIAEIKRKSPSAGIIREPFDPVAIAQGYEAAGASAISCLMDRAYFGGGEDDFRAVRAAVSLPMLYKEFVVDVWQIAHAQQLGASGVLLIAAVLSDLELRSFSVEVFERGMTPLVEVHDRKEMDRALQMGATCIGINNRNLKTFETTLEVTYALAREMPDEITLISESGIRTSEDVLALQQCGVQALLVGEQLLRQPCPREAVDNLMKEVS
jgi:indole-3-glycerol phosphate synthase